MNTEGIASGNVDYSYIQPQINDYIFNNLLKKTDALVASNFVDNIISRCYLVAKTDRESNVDQLTAQLDALRLKRKVQTIPLVDSARILVDGKDEEVLCIRVPNIDANNTGQMKNLAYLTDITLDICNFKRENLRIMKDPSLGSDLKIPAQINNMLASMKASVHSSTGDYAGNVIQFHQGFKANLVEILAAIKLLRMKQDMLRKINMSKIPDNRKFSHINQTMLREKFNQMSGIMKPDTGEFLSMYLKYLFSFLTRYGQKRFPGIWINSLRKRNNVASNEALFAKMGYLVKGINAHKVLSVLFQTVKEAEDGTLRLTERFPKNSEDDSTHPEFRAGVITLLPLINPEEEKPLKDQTNRGLLSIESRSTLNFYSENSEMVEAGNLAYAINRSLKGKNPKAKAAHFQSARNAFINKTANLKFLDYAGNAYSKYSDIPINIREYLQKLLRRKIGSKRSVPEEEETLKENHSKDVAMTPAPASGRRPKRVRRNMR